MNLQALTTTIVSGVLTLGLIVSTTVLIVTGNDVPEQFPTLIVAGFGLSVGGSIVGAKGA
jgi:hypothetical protein